jgi:hypothetical protein
VRSGMVRAAYDRSDSCLGAVFLAFESERVQYSTLFSAGQDLVAWNGLKKRKMGREAGLNEPRLSGRTTRSSHFRSCGFSRRSKSLMIKS